MNDKLEKNERCSYKFKRYRTQYQKYFMNYNIIKIHYEIDEVKYIFIFGLNASNGVKPNEVVEEILNWLK
ncbi:hypothetical protein [Dethiothermospora halolimnae]|uniref:hypothetical protein n=1 Tax=Dethiothermospora halolimnae TaxID=3114390 RepID=UPI003CCBF322